MADERNAQDGQHGSDGQPADEQRLIPDEEIAEDGQVYVDRDNIDFDPEEGLYSGTAVHGGTDIPGPHEQVDDIDPNDAEHTGDSHTDDSHAGDSEAPADRANG